MDLNDLIPESDEVIVNLVHPKTKEPLPMDDGTPMTVTLYAPHSKEYKRAMYAQAEKRIKSEKEELTVEELEQHSVEFLVAITKSWCVQRGNKVLKNSPKEYLKAYEEIFWLKPQLEERLSNYEVFTKA